MLLILRTRDQVLCIWRTLRFCFWFIVVLRMVWDLLFSFQMIFVNCLVQLIRHAYPCANAFTQFITSFCQLHFDENLIRIITQRYLLIEMELMFSDTGDPWIRQSNSSLLKVVQSESKAAVKRRDSMDIKTGAIHMKDVICYLSILEASSPDDKLECKYELLYRLEFSNFTCNKT